MNNKRTSRIFCFSACAGIYARRLRTFCKRRISYATVSDQYDYLLKEIKVNEYPTHFVLNRQGKILIKTTDFRAMQYVLEKEVHNNPEFSQ